MKTVSPLSPLAIAEAAWIESESIHLLMARVMETQLIVLVAQTLMVVMMYGHLPTVQLITWYTVNIALSLCRIWLLGEYRRSDARRNKAARDVSFTRYSYLVPVIGFFWAASVYLFYSKVPSITASFCLFIVGVYGIFSTTYLSNHARLLKRFLIAYALGLTGSVAAQVLFDQHFQIDKEQIWFLMMVALFVLLLNRVGERMNRTFIKSLKLQHRNKRLINSLTQQREAALSAVATKNRLLASAAHDMRQPVLALDIYADWLMSEPSASKELSPKISAATKAVIALFDSLFDMAKLAEGQISVNVSRINIKTLMDDLSVQYLPIAQAKQLDLRMRMFKKEGRDCDVDLWTDPLLIKRILGNLISNAIKYTDAGGVLVACRNTLKGIRFEIWDTGVGIAAEQQDLVFREFYKGSTNTGTTDGFGLGLAIVTQLTELLGYELVMKSRVGRGTTMSLQLTIQY
jgi:signal transduction histidine kinase